MLSRSQIKRAAGRRSAESRESRQERTRPKACAYRREEADPPASPPVAPCSRRKDRAVGPGTKVNMSASRSGRRPRGLHGGCGVRARPWAAPNSTEIGPGRQLATRPPSSLSDQHANRSGSLHAFACVNGVYDQGVLDSSNWILPRLAGSGEADQDGPPSCSTSIWEVYRRSGSTQRDRRSSPRTARRRPMRVAAPAVAAGEPNIRSTWKARAIGLAHFVDGRRPRAYATSPMRMEVRRRRLFTRPGSCALQVHIDSGLRSRCWPRM